VTWRYSNDYCGWAPLPPRAVYRDGVGFFYNGLAVGVGFDFGLSWNCFAFVPIGHFCDPHPRRYCVAPAQITQVYNHTTVINNFNGHGRNLANRGIDPEHITAVTHTSIRPVALRDTTAPSGHGPRADQLSRDGSTLIVGRPGSINNPAPGGNRNNRPAQSGSPAQNHSPQQNNNWPASQTRQGGQPQERNNISVPAQRPSSSANYNSSPKPYYDSRTISPRAREQQPLQSPRGNTRNSDAWSTTPSSNRGQSGASEASHDNAPIERPQHNESSSSPRSSGQNQNQNSSGNNSNNGPGNGSGHGPGH
jgi:hypothetical protein